MSSLAEIQEAIEKLATTVYSFSREQLARMTPTDRHVLESYFSRRKGMPRSVRARLSHRLVETFLTKTGYTPSAPLKDDDDAFLASLWRDLSLLQEQRL